jgi:outer membrane receptor protein involved in Fe transport
MNVRVLVLASLSAGLIAECGFVLAAPDNGSYTTELPPVEVNPPENPSKPAPRRRPTSTAPATATGVRSGTGGRSTAITRVRVFPTTPSSTPGTALAVDKVPSSINFVDTPEIQRTNSLNVMDALQQNVAGVNISNVAGNEFQSNIEFRGFVASPVSGTPQGLAVYQNGVRINEAFGDTVNWDLIPTLAIKSIAVVTNNPAYGLNALGGAVTVQMKNGFNYHGTEVDIMGGSFGRIQGSAQWGQQYGTWAVYGALEGVHDDGYRYFGSSDVRRFYGDIGYRYDGNEIHLNMGAAQNNFGASATVPVELLQQYWGAIYTSPQTSQNQVGYLNLTGKFEVTPTWTIDAIGHYRAFTQHTVDGNPTATQVCANPALLCFGDDSTPANGLNGQQLANPFPDGATLGEIDRTFTNTNTGGFSLQATNTDRLFGHENRFVVGTSFDASVTHFGATAELGTIGSNFVVNGSGIFLGQSGVPVSDGPVSLRTTNQYTGIYALDTFDVTKAFSVTAGGRFNDARISLQDQIGTALNGNDTYDRFNPMIGATYKIAPGLTAYAGYSEANRAPTPLELGCANPAQPCIIATFLVSDPPLKQVVSQTYEAGFRGTRDFSFGTLDWKVGGFRATNNDDILAIPSPVLQGFGFFQNVGDTRRQGVEAEASLKSSRWQMRASYAFIDARFLDSLLLQSNSPFADPTTGNIQVSPGNIIPTIPRHRIKASFDYSVTDAFKVGGDALWVSSQYFFGDDSNQAPQLPSYAVFSAHASYQIDKTYQIYGRVDNIFDNRYATYGNFFETDAIPNFANGGNPFTDPRSLAPARPRAFYAGLKATF